MKYIIKNTSRPQGQPCHLWFLDDEGRKAMLTSKKEATRFSEKLSANVVCRFTGKNTEVIEVKE